MIEISYIPDQACFAIQTQVKPYPEVCAAGPAPSSFWSPCDLTIITSSRRCEDPVVERASESFGFIRTSHNSWGALRDKDVYHSSASGKVVLNSVASSIALSPPIHSSYPKAVVLGRSTKIGTSTAVRHAVVPFGEDFTSTTTVNLPWFKHPTHGDVSVSSFTCTHRLRFSGNYYVHEVINSPCVATKVGTDEVVGTYNGTCYVRWGKRVPLSNAFMMSTLYTSAWSTSKGCRYYPVSASYKPNVGECLPDCTKYGINPSLTVTKVTTTLGTGVSRAGVGDVQSYLRSENFPGWIAAQFATCYSPYDYGELASDIIRSQSYVDANLLLTAVDLVTLKIDVQSLANFASLLNRYGGVIKRYGIRTVAQLQRYLKRIGKGTASQYLGVQYGVLPTVADAGRVASGIIKLMNELNVPRRLHARRETVIRSRNGAQVQSTHVLTVEVDSLPDGFGGGTMAVIRGLKKWGVYPNFDTLWDFVPFSFVFDWITDGVSNLAEYADTVVDSQYFPIHYCIASTKRKMSVSSESWSPPSWGLAGTIEFCIYDRYCMRELPLPSLQTGDGASPDFSHWGEALALIVQRKR